MNILDIILFAIIAIFMVRGLLRGLVQEILSLAATVIGLYLASNYSHLLAPQIKQIISNDLIAGGVTYILILFGTMIVAWLLTKIIKALLDITLLSWVDRSAGAIFGCLEGILISLILLMFLQAFAADSQWLTDSRLAPYAQPLVDYLSGLAPASLRDMFTTEAIYPSAIDAIRKTIDLTMGQPLT